MAELPPLAFTRVDNEQITRDRHEERVSFVCRIEVKEYGISEYARLLGIVGIEVVADDEHGVVVLVGGWLRFRLRGNGLVGRRGDRGGCGGEGGQGVPSCAEIELHTLDVAPAPPGPSAGPGPVADDENQDGHHPEDDPSPSGHAVLPLRRRAPTTLPSRPQ